MSGKKGVGLGPRPHTWLTGPDETRHNQYNAFLRQRAQANYRSEVWSMTFEEFESIWGDRWHKRGRGSADLCMSRRDYDQPWSVANCCIMSRGEHVRTSSRVKVARGQIGPVHKRKFRIV
jgi:hypothetical protein